MRARLATVLALMVGTVLAAAPSVHASDERHRPGVGSVTPAGSRVRGFAGSGEPVVLRGNRPNSQRLVASEYHQPPEPANPRAFEPPTKNSPLHFQADSPPAPPSKADPLWNGIGIGAAVGAGAGLGLIGWGYAHCEGCDAPEPGGMYAMGAGMGAAIGAVVGLVIDASRKDTNRRVLVGGVVTPKRSQVRVAVRW